MKKLLSSHLNFKTKKLCKNLKKFWAMINLKEENLGHSIENTLFGR